MFWKICEQIFKITIRFQIIRFRRLCYAINNYRTICTIDSINHYNGVKASAILYSLVETAKANMINTFEYFNLLFAEIPQHMDDKISDLLMLFFHCHPEGRKHVSADIKSLNFSMCISILINLAQSLLKCGDFCFPVLIFKDLPMKYECTSKLKSSVTRFKFVWSKMKYVYDKNTKKVHRQCFLKIPAPLQDVSKSDSSWHYTAHYCCSCQ